MIVGHREYWPQFPGQREEQCKSGEVFEALLERCGSEVIRYFAEDGTQMIDTQEEAFRAGIFFKKNFRSTTGPVTTVIGSQKGNE